MSRISLKFLSLLFLGLVSTAAFAIEDELPEVEDGKKACIYIVASPGSMLLYCSGSGSVCDTKVDCFLMLN